MAGHFAILQSTEPPGPITEKTQPVFLQHLQQTLLLALQEQGILRISEYRRAEEKLLQQYRGPAGGAG